MRSSSTARSRAVPGDELVDPDLHPLLDQVAQALDLAGPERRGHELAQPGVVGVVEQHQRAPAPVAGVAALDLGHGVRGRVRVVDDRRHREVAQDGVDVVVAGDDPALQQLGLVDGILDAQAAVLVVGPLDEPLLEGVEGRGRCGRAHVLRSCCFAAGRSGHARSVAVLRSAGLATDGRSLIARTSRRRRWGSAATRRRCPRDRGDRPPRPGWGRARRRGARAAASRSRTRRRRCARPAS